MTMVEANLPAPWFYSDLLGPVTKGQCSCMKWVITKGKKSHMSEFTNIETPPCLLSLKYQMSSSPQLFIIWIWYYMWEWWCLCWFSSSWQAIYLAGSGPRLHCYTSVDWKIAQSRMLQKRLPNSCHHAEYCFDVTNLSLSMYPLKLLELLWLFLCMTWNIPEVSACLWWCCYSFQAVCNVSFIGLLFCVTAINSHFPLP